MRKQEVIHEIDAHLSSLSSASHSQLTMPQVKARRTQLHLWRKEAAVLADGAPELEELVRKVYETNPIG